MRCNTFLNLLEVFQKYVRYSSLRVHCFVGLLTVLKHNALHILYNVIIVNVFNEFILLVLLWWSGMALELCLNYSKYNYDIIYEINYQSYFVRNIFLHMQLDLLIWLPGEENLYLQKFHIKF